MNRHELLKRYNQGERDFSGVDLSGENLSDLDLRDINLSGARLTRANLSRSNLSRSNLTYAKLSGNETFEIMMLLDVNLTYAKLENANLKNAVLIRVHLENADLRNINLANAIVRRSNLIKTTLIKANLEFSDLSFSNLTEANLTEANLTGSNLESANLSYTNLTNTNLRGANLTKSKLFQANLNSANLMRSNLKDTILINADLTGVNLTHTENFVTSIQSISDINKDIVTVFNQMLNFSSKFLSRLGILETQNLSSEDQTKLSLILPFINLLGYDLHDPLQVQTEYIADYQKKGQKDKVDYALLIDQTPVIFIEAKPANQNNLEDFDGQLKKYFVTNINVKIGIITNGIVYRFFTDSQHQNIMDDQPFFVFDFLNFTQKDVEFLQLFDRTIFDINIIKEKIKTN